MDETGIPFGHKQKGKFNFDASFCVQLSLVCSEIITKIESKVVYGLTAVAS